MRSCGREFDITGQIHDHNYAHNARTVAWGRTAAANRGGRQRFDRRLPRPLAACDEAGLIQLVSNTGNRYHGPALTQGVSALAAAAADGEDLGRWIWLVDSDAVLARANALDNVLAHAGRSGASVLGELQWDQWHGRETLAGFTQVFEPAVVWRPPTRPFDEGGDPFFDFETSCRERGLVVGDFPFTADGYLIHLGRGSLAGVHERAERTNEHFEWAKDHHDPHFQLVDGASERYAGLVSAFESETGVLTPAVLVEALIGLET